MFWVKQYGLKRSGTNYVKYLIEKNFVNVSVLVNILGWKHGKIYGGGSLNRESWYYDYRPEEWAVNIEMNENREKEIKEQIDKIGMSYVISVKHPLSWIVSMCRYEKVYLEDLGANKLKFLAAKWGEYTKDYYMFCSDYENSLIVRYEDLLENFDDTMSGIGKKLKLERDSEKWENAVNVMGAGADKHTLEEIVTKDEFDNRAYLEKEYLGCFSFGQKEMVKSNIDDWLLEELKYDF